MKRQLGQGVTDQERALEAVIGHIPGWQGREIRYQPVSGGISNTNWRVTVDGMAPEYFVKVPGRGTEMFVNRAAAHDASVKAADCGVSARVFHFVEELGVEVFEFLDGYRASSNGDFLDPGIRRNAARALRRFSTQEPLKLTKTIFEQTEEHLEQIRELGGYTPPDKPWVDRQYQAAKGALVAAGIDVAPCLNDNLAGNFMLNAAGDVILVDFEYASNNDPHYELALWFGEMFFTPDVEHEMVEEYFGEARAETLARVYLYKALADVKWSNWAWVQRQVSQLDFDFHKYGAWKHMRARQVMQDPRWEEALRAV
ncbi:choline kinase family protein [Aquisalimonas asiatica]|uniref:Thiamine kinase n=1 Tax=Aquisalimonas asiatica TaxID=406100 RepID=A0A1H8Q0A7_9GAMM|nr:choline kinase family protein [Aquisalimonas asiatica]SEO47213.1 Thiamine kinase [Aquisalimonas asiatica]